MHLASLALASTLIAFSGCSGDDDNTPAPGAGAPGTAGTPSGVGGAAAGAGGTPGMAGTPGVAGAAAGSAGAPGTAGAGMAGSGAGGGASGDPVQGKTAYLNQNNQCSLCHGMEGQGLLGPNITGSVTAGIGSWGEATFIRSVREAVDKDGQKLCSTMQKYSPAMIPDATLKNIYAYLMSVPNNTPNRPPCD